jgi:TonB-linked SusC/RagA family outer membrane protein
MKISNYKRLIFMLFLSFGMMNVMSQETGSPDEQKVSTVVPGNLFSVDKVKSTGAVSTIVGDTLYKSATPNLINTLSGQATGLFTVNGNGTPGWDIGNLYIRGIGSYAQYTGNTTLRYYVDGFEVTSDYVQYLSPSEIKSVSVLKDAAALSTFGTRGADGILWIETKRGTIGAPVITFQARTGIQQAINVNKALNAADFEALYNQALSNDNGMIWSPAQSTGYNVNWYDEIFKKTGQYSDIDLSFRGGSATARYNVVLNYANQQGLFNVKNTDKTSNIGFQKYGVRANFDIDFSKFLSVSVDLGGRLEDRSGPNYDAYQLTQDVLNYPSNIYPIYDDRAEDPISNFSGTSIYPNNPMGSLTGLGRTTSRTRILQANFKFKENFDFLLKGLYLQEGFSFYTTTRAQTGKTRTYARYFNGTAQTSDVSTYIRSSGYGANRVDQWMQGHITVGYDGKFDKHEVAAAFNLHISDYKGPNNQFYSLKNHFLNYNGKINYSYDKRYIAELGVSYFGTDGFAPGKRYQFYPTLSAAWVASNEEFLKSNDIIKFLKVRASVGSTGSALSDEPARYGLDFNTGGRFFYQQYYAYSGGFVTGLGPAFGGGSSGFVPFFTANENVGPEKSLKYNVGIDLNLLSKLNVSVDVFMDKRSNILTFDNSVMDYYGRNLYYANIGKMTNQGFEALVSYSDKVGQVSYSLHGMVSYAKNKIDYMAEVPPKFAYNAATGLPLGTKMGLEAIGYYQLNDFNADGSLKSGIPEPLFGDVQPGDLRYKDQDGDNYVDQTDYVKIGEPDYPKWAYSFGGEVAYKGFDFSVLFTGAAGASVSLTNSAWRPFLDNGNAYEWAKGAWAYYPEQGIDNRANATFPRLSTQQNDNNYQPSTFWIRSNNYLRLKNVELGYEFSNTPFVKNAGISKLRLFVNALNPLTFSSILKDYNMDPEATGYSYPSLKSYNVGVQITF